MRVVDRIDAGKTAAQERIHLPADAGEHQRRGNPQVALDHGRFAIGWNVPMPHETAPARPHGARARFAVARRIDQALGNKVIRSGITGGGAA
ncbi:MAG: hypothetical protein H0X45_03810 [Planctomycetes bacterium]|nr:hypothetical protein [Planctomycetota bacterium]